MGSLKQTLREVCEQGIALTTAYCASRDAKSGTLEKSPVEQLRLEQKANELHIAHRQNCYAILKRLEEWEAGAPQPGALETTEAAAPEPVQESNLPSEPEPQVQTAPPLPLASLFGEDEVPDVSPGLAALIQ